MFVLSLIILFNVVGVKCDEGVGLLVADDEDYSEKELNEYSGNGYDEDSDYDYYSASGSDDDIYDYDYYANMDDYYEEDRDTEDVEELEDVREEQEVHVKPEMRSRSLNISISQGSNLTLPCQATDSEHLVRLWLKEDELLFTDTIRSSFVTNNLTMNSSMMVDSNHNLVLHNISIGHSGHYTCRILVAVDVDGVEVGHSVQVVQEEVQGTDDQRFTVREGEMVSISCEDTSSREHVWSREGFGKFFTTDDSDDNTYSFSQPVYRVMSARRADAGRYYCDGILVAHVVVEFEPRVITLTKRVQHDGMGVAMLIECQVQAQPQPRVTWYKGAEVVELDERVVQMQDGIGSHALVFRRVRNDDIGNFVCLATNKLGRDQRSLVVDQDDFNRPQDRTMDKVSQSPRDSEQVSELKGQLRQMAERITFLESKLNHTSNMSMSSSSMSMASRPLEKAIFADLLSLQNQIQTVSQRLKQTVRPLQTTTTTLQEEVLVVRDALIEVQENVNVTARIVDQLYSDDIFELMNFKRRTDNELSMLKQHLSSVSDNESHQQVDYGNLTEQMRLVTRDVQRLEADQLHQLTSNVDTSERVDRVAMSLRSVNKTQIELGREVRDQRVALDTLQSVVEDELRRELQRLEIEFGRMRDEITDIDVVERQSDLDNGLKLLIREVQSVKSQVFRLQKAMLNVQVRNVTTDSNISPNTTALMAQVSLLESSQTSMESRLAEVELLVEKWSVSCSEMNSKLEMLEEERLKYNLLIFNMTATRRLERPRHLEQLAEHFFTDKLKLTEIHLDEVERLDVSTLRVKFPSVRSKSKVLTAARRLRVWQVQEDFSEAVRRRRRQLMEFVRQKLQSNVQKRRWALNKDQLLFNGQVYVVDEASGQIRVLKRL